MIGIAKTDRELMIGVALLVALLAVIAVASADNIARIRQDDRKVELSRRVIDEVEGVMTALRDAETAQRGYLLTDNAAYLEPFVGAGAELAGRVEGLGDLSRDYPRRAEDFDRLAELALAKVAEIRRTLDARRDVGRQAAVDIVRTGKGKKTMDDARSLAGRLDADERALLARRLAKRDNTYSLALLSVVVSALFGLAMIGAFVGMLGRYFRNRRKSSDKLLEQREMLQLTLAGIGDGVLTADANGRVTFLNDVAEQLTGWKRAEALGRPAAEVFRIVREDTGDQVECPVAAALRTGVVVGVPHGTTLVARTGTRRPIDDSASPLRHAGNVVGVVLVFRDVAERRDMEKHLAERHREAEADRLRLRAVLDALPTGVIIADKQGRILEVNDAIRRVWGDDLPDTPSMAEYGRWKGWWPDGREIRPDEWAMARALTTGETCPGEEVEIERFDGARAFIVNSAAPIRDASGEIVGGVVAETDVTPQKRLREQLETAVSELRESEARFRLVADTMPQIVWVSRPDGFHEYYNRRWYDYIGASPEDSIGHGWSDPLHPDDRERSKERWTNSLKTGEPYEVEHRLRAKAGDYRWFLGRALPVRDASGAIVKWYGTCTDIEDFKQVQEDRAKFVSLVENSSDFIGMATFDGLPFYVNDAGLRLVGLDSLDEARRTPVTEFLHPQDRERVFNEFLPRAMQSGHGSTEVRFQHFKTGAVIWMHYALFPLTAPDGRRIGVATVSRDITYRRQLEDNLRQVAADLSEANRRKDEFLATLAHELRNPLAPIRNGLQILRLARKNEQAVEQARAMMDRQLGQMVRLVDDLLDISRITRNKLELKRERIDLGEVLRSAAETAKPLADASRHELTVSLADGPIPLDGDFVRLSQVFANLLNNAAKYTPPGGKIRLEASASEGVATVTVRDNGLGIPAEMLGRIFDMFTQVDTSLERAQGGLGIGLTLVRRLVEMHRGTVDAASDGLGKGSTFDVRLPLAGNERLLVRAAVVERGDGVGPRRLLIIDDNIDAGESLAVILRLKGHTVEIRHDGLEGVSRAETFLPDVVFLDVGLPRLNGYEICRRIRSVPVLRDTIVIALTGFGSDDDRRRGREAGFDHYLLKPVAAADVEALLG